MDYQEILAKCYVAMSEINYDLISWELDLLTFGAFLSSEDAV